jgi:hypothetical protein
MQLYQIIDEHGEVLYYSDSRCISEQGLWARARVLSYQLNARVWAVVDGITVGALRAASQ